VLLAFPCETSLAPVSAVELQWKLGLSIAQQNIVVKRSSDGSALPPLETRVQTVSFSPYRTGLALLQATTFSPVQRFTGMLLFPLSFDSR